tara:strand:+ start:723 stop:905 length:183 start_codon:yes stop_codon:yes gene_type:complete
MELFVAMSLPIIFLFGLTLIFMSDRIPSWVQQINRNNSTLWNFGVVAISSITLIIYLSRS